VSRGNNFAYLCADQNVHLDQKKPTVLILGFPKFTVPQSSAAPGNCLVCLLPRSTCCQTGQHYIYDREAFR